MLGMLSSLHQSFTLILGDLMPLLMQTFKQFRFVWWLVTIHPLITLQRFSKQFVYFHLLRVCYTENTVTHTTGLRKKLSANKHRARTVVSSKYLKMFQNKNILKCSDNIFLVLKEKMFISSVAFAHWIWSSLRLAHDIDGKALLWWCSGLLPL